MDLHFFDRDTGEFLYKWESSKPQIPFNATDVEPPSPPSGEVAAYRDGSWKTLVDNRGTVYYDDSGERYTIRELGKTVPSWGLPDVPEDVKAERRRGRIFDQIEVNHDLIAFSGTTFTRPSDGKVYKIPTNSRTATRITTSDVRTIREATLTQRWLLEGQILDLDSSDLSAFAKALNVHIQKTADRRASLKSAYNSAPSDYDPIDSFLGWPNEISYSLGSSQTAEVLPTDGADSFIAVRADSGNSSVVYVGDSDVSNSTDRNGANLYPSISPDEKFLKSAPPFSLYGWGSAGDFLKIVAI